MKTVPQTCAGKQAKKVKLAIAPLESKVTPTCDNLDYCMEYAVAIGVDPSLCLAGGRLAVVADY